MWPFKKTDIEQENIKLKADLKKLDETATRELRLAKDKIEMLIKDIKKAKLFDPVRHSNGIFDISYYRRFLRLFIDGKKCVLVNMQMKSGKRDFFVVSGDASDFSHKGKTYILSDYGRYHIPSLDMMAYDFHEDISLPILHNIGSDDIKRAVNESGIECNRQIDPLILDDYIKAKISQNVIASGAKLHSYLGLILILVIILLAELTIFFIIFVVKTGMLSQLKTGIMG